MLEVGTKVEIVDPGAWGLRDLATGLREGDIGWVGDIWEYPDGAVRYLLRVKDRYHPGGYVVRQDQVLAVDASGPPD